MKVLILGSGGREHVLAAKLSKELGAHSVYVMPGNAGTAKVAQNVSGSVTDFSFMTRFCLQEDIDFILPGSEESLVAGVRDALAEKENTRHIYVFGPDKLGASLEGSKEFAKQFMERHGIPTAMYKSFTEEQIGDAMTWLINLQPPYVLKADGLAAGKGVLICEHIDEAEAELQQMLFDKKFGQASSKVVIEEFLSGIEFSVFVATDGEHYALLPEAKDYKRIGEGDTGLNTGGMGAVSPVPFADKALMDKVRNHIIEPTIRGLHSEGIDYRGFIFFGLMNCGGDPYVIEYNVRMGDPETEVVFPRVNGELSKMLSLAAEKRLNEWDAKVSEDYCTTIFTVSEGYPEAYEKGKEISLPAAPENGVYFHAGTALSGEKLLTSGGRVIACSYQATSLSEALEGSFRMADSIAFEGKYFRKDIGKDLSEPS